MLEERKRKINTTKNGTDHAKQGGSHQRTEGRGGDGIGLVYLQSCGVADGLKVDIMSGDPFTNNAFTHDRYMV
jgi:hypothetical protein